MILVDDQDRWVLEAVRWHIHKVAKSELRYVMAWDVSGASRRLIALHRLIAEAPDGLCVDHINGNGLDCRRSNLRICTHAQNMRNRKVSKSNKLGVKGVWRERERFRAQIKADGKRHQLGSFDTVADAAEAYRLAALQLHGEFARPA